MMYLNRMDLQVHMDFGNYIMQFIKNPVLQQQFGF